jgi:hypothetical protein
MAGTLLWERLRLQFELHHRRADVIWVAGKCLKRNFFSRFFREVPYLLRVVYDRWRAVTSLFLACIEDFATKAEKEQDIPFADNCDEDLPQIRLFQPGPGYFAGHHHLPRCIHYG